MSTHPLNLFLRFLLELCAFAAIGVWGWQQSDSWVRYILMICLPGLAAVIWGVFAVPEDPSRSGAAPVPVSGLVRLIIELTIFAVAVLLLYRMNYSDQALVLAVTVTVHYALSFDRMKWLLSIR